MIIFTFYYSSTSLALVLLNQEVTLIWKLLNLAASSLMVLLVLAIISRARLNYYFEIYSVLSLGSGEAGTGRDLGCCCLMLLVGGYWGLRWGSLVVWVS